MSTSFIMPSMNIMGENALADAVATLGGRGFAKALIVTDAGLARLGVADDVARALDGAGITAVIFDGAQPNPTVGNVDDGLALIRQHGCDLVVSQWAGGSSHDWPRGA